MNYGVTELIIFFGCFFLVCISFGREIYLAIPTPIIGGRIRQVMYLITVFLFVEFVGTYLFGGVIQAVLDIVGVGPSFNYMNNWNTLLATPVMVGLSALVFWVREQ